jgi:serine/threonine-protein kinase
LIGALLLETMSNNRLLDGSRLRTFGNDILQSVWEQVGPYQPVSEDRQLAYLGIAHGWSGILYATLRWCQATGEPIPAAVEPRLRQLADCAEPGGHGLRWRRKNARHGRDGRRHDRDAGVDYLSGWCNGSAGHIFLWTLAHRLFGDAAYLALAEGAAWHAWEDAESVGDLCCGLAGRAYGLLNLYKHSGEVQWLHRGQELAVRAADVVQKVALRRDGLYKGEVGVAVLAADLSRPQEACMPFFEGEGW